MRGTTYVPNFQLKMAGNPLPLSTTFEALVDGTNGNTVLQPVRATLGHTNFTTDGAVIKHEEYSKRSINLEVTMPQWQHARSAAPGHERPAVHGRLHQYEIEHRYSAAGPKVKEKLVLDGTFDLNDAKFLKSTIQHQIDQLSRRGQGQPKNEEIDRGDFQNAGFASIWKTR